VNDPIFVTGLTNWLVYTFEVWAANPGGEGAPSALVSATPRAAGPTPPAKETIVLQPFADTFADASQPDATHESDQAIFVSNAYRSEQRAFLGFDLGALPSGVHFEKVELNLYLFANFVPGGTQPAVLDVRNLVDAAPDFDEAALTWSNQPVAGATIGSTIPVAAPVPDVGFTLVPAHNVIQLDAAAIQDWMSQNSASWLGLELELSSSSNSWNDWCSFYPREYSNASYRPWLSVTYTRNRVIGGFTVVNPNVMNEN